MSFMAALTQGMPSVPQQMVPGGGTQSYLSRVPSLPDNLYTANSLYSHHAAGAGAHQQHPTTQQQQSTGSDLKAASSLGQHYFVDHMMNPHPYSALYPGFDINAVRRKNATRETTGPLKAWLSQHRKNPYPTKGEKVMLAIATRMTLTQVSTWFANARRRMKKDNLSEDDDHEEEKENGDIRNRSGSLSSRVSQTSSEADISKDSDLSKDLDNSDLEEHSGPSRPLKKCVQRLFSPDARTDHVIDPSSSPESLSERLSETDNSRLPPLPEMVNTHPLLVKPQPVNVLTGQHNVPSQKPKIWSISEIIGSAAKTVSDNSSHYPTGSTVSGYSTYPSMPEQYAYNSYQADYSNYGLYQNNTYSGYQGDTTSPSQHLNTSDSDTIVYL